MIKNLCEYINDIGYPRKIFKKLYNNIDDIKKAHILFKNTYTKPVELNDNILANGYYIFFDNNNIMPQSHILYKFEKVIRKRIKPGMLPEYNKCSIVENYHKKHLISSIIKNVLFKINSNTFYSKPVALRGNILVYLLYYHVFYNSIDLTFIEMTETVINDITYIISMLLQREHTTYKEYDIDDVLETLRYRLKLERMHDISNNSFNIRRR